MVGLTGFEPAASCTPCKHATKLRYSPTFCVAHTIEQKICSQFSIARFSDILMENSDISLPQVRPYRSELTPAPRSKYPFYCREHPILDVEIGAGVGLHPLRYCEDNPKRFLVAIEHSNERFKKFQRRIGYHSKRSNLLAVHEDAESFFVCYLEKESVDRIFLLYPNPYPKPVHLNRRWHAMPFAAQILKTLKVGGTLHLATNENFYAQESVLYWCRIWGLINISHKIIDGSSNGPTYRSRTHFEKKYLARGEKCFDFIFQKNDPITSIEGVVKSDQSLFNRVDPIAWPCLGDRTSCDSDQSDI